MANCTTSTTTSSRAASAAAASAALTAMLAFNVCPAQAFQSTTFLVPAPRATHHHAAPFSSPTAPTTTTMRHLSPWDLDCRGGNNMEQFRRGRRLQRQRRRNRFTPTIFDPSGGFHQDSQLQQVGDPEVKETDDTYQLTFDLPAEVDRDGLEVSVSGRLLTVKARVTREDASADTRGGWVRRSSRTDSVSRSFVLPEGKGISSSGATASLTEDGKAEVNFFKTFVDGAGAAMAPAAAAAVAATPTADSSPAAKASSKPAATAHTESKTGRVGGVTVGEKEKSPPSSFSSSAEYLSSLSGADQPTAPATENASATKNAEVGETPAAGPTSQAGRATSRSTRSSSVFDSLDDEFGQFAKALWGEDMVLRFPTQEEVEKRNKAAREARAKRVLAIRRATMAAKVSQNEDDGSYIVRVALPEDATRDGIKLLITPENTLRVSYSAGGRRSLSKDVRLPKDADLSQISAKFEAEHEERGGGESGTSSVVVGAVSGLEVTVQKAAVPEPKRVEIE